MKKDIMVTPVIFSPYTKTLKTGEEVTIRLGTEKDIPGCRLLYKKGLTQQQQQYVRERSTNDYIQIIRDGALYIVDHNNLVVGQAMVEFPSINGSPKNTQISNKIGLGGGVTVYRYYYGNRFKHELTTIRENECLRREKTYYITAIAIVNEDSWGPSYKSEMRLVDIMQSNNGHFVYIFAKNLKTTIDYEIVPNCFLNPNAPIKEQMRLLQYFVGIGYDQNTGLIQLGIPLSGNLEDLRYIIAQEALVNKYGRAM